ncbi:DUF7501 family protein [Haladaptatus sp. NG-SE-30]
MTPQTQPAQTTAEWNDPQQCPFCNAALDDGGWGFIVHIRENQPCNEEFEMWREQISGDMRGEWAG